MYFKLKPYLEKYPNKFYYTFLGGRGTGKSFDIKDNIFRDYLENGEQAVVLRRYVNQLDDIKNNYMDDVLMEKYPDFMQDITYKHDAVYYKDEPFIYFMGLNRKGVMKAGAYPKVTKIVYEEFTPQAGERYLSKEYQRLETLAITIDRFQDRVTCFLLGNTTTTYNPVFQAMKCYPPLDYGVKQNSEILIARFPTDEDLAEKQTNSRLGRVTKKSGSYAYNIQNENLSNEMFNIIPKKEFFKIPEVKKDTFNPVITCQIDIDKYIRLWQGNSNILYVDVTNKPSNIQCFYDYDFQNKNNVHISMVEHPVLDIFSFLYKQGRVFFSNVEAKTFSTQIFTFNNPL